MSEMVAIKNVTLNESHLRPGRTKHSISDKNGRSEFPPFTSLVITQCPDDPGFYLMHVCANGQIADTWHETLDDALHQAEYEFEVKPEEWAETSEPF
jgi:hypothetical protein